MKLILFDGVCNLCNGFVKFIIKRDEKEIFTFSALQSDYAKTVLSQNGIDSSRLDTVFYFDGEHLFERSEAAILILSQLKGLSWIKVFQKMPKSFSDAVYKFISKNRYSFFSKRESCMLPEPNLLERFKN